MEGPNKSPVTSVVKKDTLQGIAEKKELLAKEVHHATLTLSVSSVDNLDIWHAIAQKKELITLTEELLVKEVLLAMISSVSSVDNLDIWHATAQKKEMELITLTEELPVKEVLNVVTISSAISVVNLDTWLEIVQKKELIILTEELLVREIQLMTILSATSVVSQAIWHAIVQTLLMRRVWQGFNAIDVGKMDTFPKIVLIKTLMKQMVDNVIGAASQAI